MDKIELKEKVEEDCLKIKKIISDVSEKVVYINNRGGNEVAKEIVEVIKK